MFFQNEQLRSILIAGYRVYAQALYLRQGPKVFINSIPKSGTHLLTTYLEGFPDLINSRLHVPIKGLHDPEVPYESRKDFSPVPARFDKILRTVRNGQFVSAHMSFHPSLATSLADHGFSSIAVMRDPRDIVVSTAKYIVGLRRHPLHQHFVENYKSSQEQIMACVLGTNAASKKSGSFSYLSQNLSSLRELLDSFEGWYSNPSILNIRFEDLVGERGGGDKEAQILQLQNIVTHIYSDEREVDFEELISLQSQKGSATLRKGQIGDWPDHLNDDHIAAIKEAAGPFMEAHGYQ